MIRIEQPAKKKKSATYMNIHSLHKGKKFTGPTNIWKVLNFRVYQAQQGEWNQSLRFHSSLTTIRQVEKSKNTFLDPLAVRIPNGNQVLSLKCAQEKFTRQREEAIFPVSFSCFCRHTGWKHDPACSRLPVSIFQLTGL